MAQSVHTRLASHPANPPHFDERIDVTLTRPHDGGFVIAYAIHGFNIDLCVPTPHTPAPTDGLWQSTCCELFAGPAGQAGYREFNFSPSGQWAVYDFEGYRQHKPSVLDCPAPMINLKRDEHLIQLDITLAATALPAGKSLRLAVAVVLKARNGMLGYWALVHPPGKPDFHHRAGFVLSLDSTGFHS